MLGEREPLKSATAGPLQFNTTHWSVVLAAGAAAGQDENRALETLFQTYWQPVYGFVRRTVTNPEDARDLTQGFFAHLIRTGAVGRADPERGRFRSFLLGALKNFMAGERDRAGALKRGGNVEFVPLDTTIAESRFAASVPAPSESQFDRDWAMTVLERALCRLREEFELSGRTALFDGLKGFLVGDELPMSYAAAALELRITEGAAKMTVTRMRQRFRAIVRREIAETVATPEQFEWELRAFVEALSG